MRTLEFLQRTTGTGITFDVLVLSGKEGELDDDFKKAGNGTIHYLPLNRSFWPRYFRILRKEKYDVVHSHVLLVSGLMLAVARASGVKNRIAHLRSTGSPMKPRLRRLRDVFLRQVVLSNATSVPCVSASVAEANIGRGWSTKRRVSVVYDGFHLLDNQSANRATPVRVGHIGRFHESKNQDFLAKVYAELVARRSDVHCTMTGKPDAEIFPRVQAILSKEIADGRVALHPQTDRIADVISSCDLMVSTSAYEGLPGAIIESLSGGVPVVASAIAPSMEIARQNEHVTIVKGWDPKHWAEVIDSTLNELLGLNKQETVSRIQKSVLTGPFYYEASDNSIIELYNAG